MKNATTHNFKKLSKDEQRKRMRKTVRLVEHKTEDIPKLEKNVANMTKAQMLDYIKIIKAEFVRRGYTK